MYLPRIVMVGFVATAGVWLSGCDKPSTKPKPATEKQVSDDAHSHNGWWCNEHGVPEDACALCDTKLVADFKAKGDWCKEHDRPESQCFACHPEKEAEFAAQYEAKYGKKPPKPESVEGHDDHDHDHAAKS